MASKYHYLHDISRHYAEIQNLPVGRVEFQHEKGAQPFEPTSHGLPSLAALAIKYLRDAGIRGEFKTQAEVVGVAFILLPEKYAGLRDSGYKVAELNIENFRSGNLCHYVAPAQIKAAA